MIKKRKVKIILIIVIVCIALTMSFFIGKTYARYLAQVNGKGEGKIANWSFVINDNENAIQNINLQSTLDNEKINNNKIAPGTSGEFNIKIDATNSDVGINYNIGIENEINKPQNLIFKYQDKSFNSMLDLAKELKGTINANDKNRVINFIIQWEWNYQTGENEQEINENDLIDAKDSKNALEYTFDIIITGNQVEV